MKKGALIGSAAVLAVIAAAGVLYWRAESADSNLIRMYLDGGDAVPEAALSALDFNQNGKIDRTDLAKAKLNAVFSGKTALCPEYFSAELAKPLGRTAYHADTGTLWCSLSGSGIAFGFRGKECRLHLTADSAFVSGENGAARYAVYLNDELVTDAQLTEPEQTVIIPNSGSEDEYAWVRLVKLSESQNSALGIRSVGVFASKAAHGQYARDVFKPAAEKAHLIEFIGDSITCGYGVDGEYGRDQFKRKCDKGVQLSDGAEARCGLQHGFLQRPRHYFRLYCERKSCHKPACSAFLSAGRPLLRRAGGAAQDAG